MELYRVYHDYLSSVQRILNCPILSRLAYTCYNPNIAYQLMKDSFLISLTSQSMDQTRQYGVILGELLQQGDVICVAGELGVGKTTFVHGLGQGWQTEDRVTSPTYTLINVYRRASDSQKLYHVDAYRLETPEAIWSVGLDDIFDISATVIIEWPERIQIMLPETYLWIEITYDETDLDSRYFQITNQGARPAQLLESFHQRLKSCCLQ